MLQEVQKLLEKSALEVIMDFSPGFCSQGVGRLEIGHEPLSFE